MTRGLIVIAFALLACCNDNMLTGKLTPVPPVHRMAIENEGRVILIAEDPVIESHDPVHIARANEMRVPRDYRKAMTSAFELAGFKVVTSPGEPHDLVAKLALAVREEPGKVHQTYRCGVRAPDGAEVAQIDWSWPIGTYVETFEVFEFATHNLATEVVTSRKVLDYLRTLRARGGASGASGGREAPPPTKTDAGPPS